MGEHGFHSCHVAMADGCFRDSKHILRGTSVLYINRHIIPLHRISEYSCHTPLADNGTFFPLASRCRRFQCRTITLIKHCRVRPDGIGNAPASESDAYGKPCDFWNSSAQTRIRRFMGNADYRQDYRIYPSGIDIADTFIPLSETKGCVVQE